MIKIIIIDDEPLARSIIKEYLQNFNNIEIAQECADGFEAIKAIQTHKPDLIFLDIQMPKVTGFELLEILENPPAIIFTTAYDEYAIKAFETNAIDYLLKPIGEERFAKAIEKFVASNNGGASSIATQIVLANNIKQPEESERVVVKNGNSIRIIPTHEIIYIEAYDDYVKIYTNETMYLKKKTLSHYENTLNTKDFLRVHRSYIVQL